MKTHNQRSQIRTWIGCSFRSWRELSWWSSFVLAIALLSFALTAGCTDTDSSGPASSKGSNSSKSSRKPKVALIMKSLANEFFKTMADGARKHQSSRADEFDLIVNGIKDERDLARQGALVEEMIAAQVDAIVIAPADSKALVSVCKRAQDNGWLATTLPSRRMVARSAIWRSSSRR